MCFTPPPNSVLVSVCTVFVGCGVFMSGGFLITVGFFVRLCWFGGLFADCPNLFSQCGNVVFAELFLVCLFLWSIGARSCFSGLREIAGVFSGVGVFAAPSCCSVLVGGWWECWGTSSLLWGGTT